MAWYPLPQSGGAMLAGDEFFENQAAGWSLWSSSTSDDQNTTRAYPDKHEDGDAQCTSGPSPDQSEPQLPQPTEDAFLVDAPFEALDLFPDSTMHRLLSYETMLNGVVTGSEEGDAELDHQGADDVMDTCGFPLFSHDSEEGDAELDHQGADDVMDTCGFPLFSHDLQDGSRNPERSNPEILSLSDPSSEEDKAGLSMAKSSRAITNAESTPGFEALVLEELEDVVFQLTKRTRICYRDAFYRLAESSRANCNCSTSRQSFQQPDGNASRFATPVGCHERETNAIDRTVVVLTINPPRQRHGNCFSDGWGPETQSRASWTTWT